MALVEADGWRQNSRWAPPPSASEMERFTARAEQGAVTLRPLPLGYLPDAAGQHLLPFLPR